MMFLTFSDLIILKCSWNLRITFSSSSDYLPGPNIPSEDLLKLLLPNYTISDSFYIPSGFNALLSVSGFYKLSIHCCPEWNTDHVFLTSSKPTVASHGLLNEVQIPATHSRCYLNSILSSFFSTICLYSNWPMYNSLNTAQIFLYLCHYSPSESNALTLISQNPSGYLNKDKLKFHESNLVSPFLWSRNNSPQLPFTSLVLFS